MPKNDVILNLPGFSIKNVTGLNPLTIEVRFRYKTRWCIYCDSGRLRIKTHRWRHIRHESIGLRQTYLRLRVPKYYCRDCHRYFSQRYPSLLPYQRSTEKLKQQVFRHHTEGISQQDLALGLKLGKSTIERWYQDYYHRHHQEIKGRPCPRVLGIDEHFFSRKQGFATTFCDLRKHRIFDVVKGRSAKSLASYLAQLPGKDQVQVVCMDLSSSYRSLVKRYFPKAKIVADRFHVIRLLNHMNLKTYHQIDPTLKYQRGLLAVLRTKPERLSPTKQAKRDDYFKQQPAIASVYDFQQRLYRLLMKKQRRATQCKRLIPILLNRLQALKQSPFEHLQALGCTLYHWREAVVCMWRFTKNNGITEGFHRKMKLIQRRAYGFKNFENYRLRVKVLCG